MISISFRSHIVYVPFWFIVTLLSTFSSFDNSPAVTSDGKNLDLLMDIKLKLTVELGRTELPIKKVLELARGSVIELDKIAGEPIDVLVNGKYVAKGEVVVIEESFGVRVTEIIK